MNNICLDKLIDIRNTYYKESKKLSYIIKELKFLYGKKTKFIEGIEKIKQGHEDLKKGILILDKIIIDRKNKLRIV